MTDLNRGPAIRCMRVGATENEGAIFRRFRGGQTFGSGQLRVDKEQIKTFAAEFDPQSFHLDPQLGGGAVEIRTRGHSPSVVPYSSYSNPFAGRVSVLRLRYEEAPETPMTTYSKEDFLRRRETLPKSRRSQELARVKTGTSVHGPDIHRLCG
jgi:hypothetical protein